MAEGNRHDTEPPTREPEEIPLARRIRAEGSNHAADYVVLLKELVEAEHGRLDLGAELVAEKESEMDWKLALIALEAPVADEDSFKGLG